MIINHNLQAMNTHRQLGIANNGGAKSMEKLSSGYRINRAGDDAAGLAISEKMRGQIRGLNQASRNAQDGISLIQTAEGALDETHAILQRMRELAVQSSTDTNTDADRTNIQDEINQLSEEITRISETTEFNTMRLLDGTFEGKRFHIGANEKQDITFDVNNMSADALGLDSNDVAQTIYKGTDADSKLTFYNEDGTALEIEFVRTSGTGANAAITGSGGKYKVTYTDSGITLAGLKSQLSGKGITVEVGDPNLDLTKLSGKTIKAGEFNQADVTAGNLKFTVTNSGLTSIDIIARAEDKNNATTTVTFSGGKLTISLGSDLSGTSGPALQAALQTKINAVMSGVLIGDIAVSGVGVSGARVSQSGIKFETKVSGKAVMIDGESLGGLKVDTQTNASRAITTINTALETVSKERSKLGSIQNRLEHTIKNLDTSAENLQASEARIRDVDMAKEMMEQTKQNILQQASTAMLAQANQAPQNVLQLLR